MAQYRIKVTLSLPDNTQGEVTLERVNKWKIDPMTGALLVFIPDLTLAVPAYTYNASTWASIDLEGVSE